MALCSFCSKSEPVRIEIAALDLRICPNCFAAFLPAAKFAALRRELNEATKAAWIRKLQTLPEQPQNAAPKCLEHGAPLVLGTIPNYSFEGFVPTCCDLQHLPPSLMQGILKISMGVSRTATRSSKSVSNIDSLVKISRILAVGLVFVVLVSFCGLSAAIILFASFLCAIFIGKFAFNSLKKKQKPMDDVLDRLQYDYKFKEVLGEWIPEAFNLQSARLKNHLQ